MLMFKSMRTSTGCVGSQGMIAALRAGNGHMRTLNKGGALAWLIVAACTGSALGAGQLFPYFDIDVRKNGQDYNVRIDYPGEEYFTGGVACNDANHRTKGNGRFGHIHFGIASGVPTDIPITGVDRNGNDCEVNWLGICAWWDRYRYSPGTYDWHGGETLKYNCHGYSLNYGTWIQDLSVIVDPDVGDLVPATDWSDVNIFLSSSINDHSILVTDRGEFEIQTEEKNCQSGRYSIWWWCYLGYPLPNLYKWR